MSTIACENCGAVLSDSAEKCPKCRYPTPKNQGRCRKCYTILAYSDHRYTRYSGNVVNGTTSGSSYIQHVPCTNCGEPEPLGRIAKEHPAARRFLLCLLFPPLFLFLGPQWVLRRPLWLRLLACLAIIGAAFVFDKPSKSNIDNNPALLSSPHKVK